MKSNKSLSDRSIVAVLNKKKRQQLRENHHYPRISDSTYKSLYSFRKDLPNLGEDEDPDVEFPLQIDVDCFSQKSRTNSPDAILNNHGDQTIVFTPLGKFNQIKEKFKNVNSKKIWKKNSLNIIQLVAKFIKQLKTHTNGFQYKMLNSKILQIVGDKGSDIIEFINLRDYDKTKQLKLYLKNLVLQVILKITAIIPIINPDNQFLLVVNLFFYALLLINITYIPLKIAFHHIFEEQTYFNIFLDDIPTLSLIISMLLSFITAYYDKGVIYYERSSIAINYLKSGFILDLICISPGFISFQYIDYVKLLRMIKIKIILTNLEEIINLRENLQLSFELIKSIYFMICVCHICACGWFKIGYFEYTLGSYNWLESKNIILINPFEQYAYSFYYIVVTTLTIGYGDISPVTIYETIFVIIIAFSVCSMLGITISSIGEVFRTMNEKQAKFKQQMRGINQYLKDYKINKTLSLQIRKYFEYHLKTQLENNNEGQEIMQQLSKPLKEKMQIDLYKKYLIKSKIIQQFSIPTIEKLCQYVKVEQFFPESDVILRNSLPNYFHYLAEGELQIHIPINDDHIELTTIQSGQFFGLREFLMQTAYKYSIKATKFSKMLMISHDEFNRIVKESPQDFDKFSQIKDKLKFQQVCKQFGQICYVCGWVHNFKKCPFVFFQANKEKLLSIQQRNEQQERGYHLRRGIKDQQSRKHLYDIRQSALDFIIEADYNSELTEKHMILLGFKNEDVIQSMDSDIQYDIQYEVQSASSQHFKRRNMQGKKKSVIFADHSSSSQSSNQKPFLKNSPQFQRSMSQDSKKKKNLKRIVQVESLLNNYLKPEQQESYQEIKGQQDLSRQTSTVEQVLQLNNEEKLKNLDIDEYYDSQHYFPLFNIHNIVDELIELQKEKLSLSPKKELASLYSKYHRDHTGRRQGLLSLKKIN